MIAKSTLGLQEFNVGSAAPRWRQRVTAFVLAASLLALLLIVHTHYGPLRFEEPFLRLKAGDVVQADPRAYSAREFAGSTPSAAEQTRYRTLSDFLAKRYRVSQQATFDLVALAHHVGQQLGLDPLLIIAVMAIESSFNPIAESVAGAKGLMQIIPKYHSQKLEEFGGERAVFDPAANVVVGAQILKEYIRLTGHVGMALQMYAGALGDNDDQYTRRVMSEKERLRQVLAQSSNGSAPTRTASAKQVASPPFP